MAVSATPRLAHVAEQGPANHRRTPGAPTLLQYEQIERQEWHLWVVAVFLMFVLGVSVLSFMFPAVFWFGSETRVAAPQRAFFGFSVLLALAMVYMLQRQATVRRLRRSLYMAESQACEREQHAAAEFLQALPGRTQFSDSLAMEFLRSTHSHMHLTVFVLEFLGSHPEDCGAAARMLCDRLRPGEGVFHVADRSLGLVLPGMSLDTASSFRAAVLEKLGPYARLVTDVRSATFPENAKSLAELQDTLRSLEEQGARLA